MQRNAELVSCWVTTCPSPPEPFGQRCGTSERPILDGGTDGSNPVPSSGESVANAAFGGVTERAEAMSPFAGLVEHTAELRAVGRRLPLQLRDAGAGAVFVLLDGATADPAGALDDAIAYDRTRSLGHDHVAALRRRKPAQCWQPRRPGRYRAR